MTKFWLRLAKISFGIIMYFESMTIVIVLLIIIAIGVLLLSDAGKKLLGLSIGIAVLGGILYVLFWGIPIGYFLISENKKDIIDLLSYIIIAGIAIWVINRLYILLKPRVSREMVNGFLAGTFIFVIVGGLIAIIILSI